MLVYVFSKQIDDAPFPNDFVYVVKPEESKNVAVKRGFATVNVII